MAERTEVALFSFWSILIGSLEVSEFSNFSSKNKNVNKPTVMVDKSERSACHSNNKNLHNRKFFTETESKIEGEFRGYLG